MHRKTVVLVEGDDLKRRLVAERIAASGREVVPVRSGSEGERFVAAFGSTAAGTAAVSIVASVDEQLESLGGVFEVRYPADLPLGGEGFDRALRRLLLALLRADLGNHRGLKGLEIDLSIDLDGGALVGDLAAIPFLELLRALGAVGGSGVLRTALGEIALEKGEVIAARTGTHAGEKAFCRLALQTSGEVRLLPLAAAGGVAGTELPERTLHRSLSDLVLAALEDRIATPPHPEARVRLRLGPQFFGGKFGVMEREILGALQEADQVRSLLDALPARSDGDILRGLGELVRQGVAVLDEPQDRARVITDTASDLPVDLAAARGIRLVPYSLSFGETFVRDREQISPADFYRELARASKGGVAPAVEPPGRGELLSLYAALLETQDLVSIHAAPRFGSALASSRAAADDALRALSGFRAQLEPPEIEVCDSRSVSLGQGLLALSAAALAGRGLPATAIRLRIEELSEELRLFVAVREEEERPRFGLFLQPVQVWTIYEIEEGELFLRERVDRVDKVPAALVDRVAERFGAKRPTLLGVAHGDLPAAAVALGALLEKRWPAAERIAGEIGPPLGATFGPGSLLLAALAG